jgi:N-acyl-phosphatidylethanolamine-hydrolysing phospholipase D
MPNPRPLLLSLALCLCSCGFVMRVLSRTNALPDQPAKVAHKLHDPRRADARLAVLWIGHATALVQLDDLFILTDPVFTRSIGGLSPRLVEPGLDPEDLPPLAAVVISHMHLDHLSGDSLAMIEDKTRVMLLPPGVQSSVPRYAFPSRELTRWQAYEAGGLRVTAVPVRHVGGRWGIDLAWHERAFTGYVFEYHGLSVYFGGDTAFDARSFREAHQHFPALDAALLPICPAEPRDYMRHVHMDPAEALDALALLGAKQLVPIHFDTFLNSDDEPGQCGRRLREAMRVRSIGEERVQILSIGEQRVLIARSNDSAQSAM